jgi:hypothetical protein
MDGKQKDGTIRPRRQQGVQNWRRGNRFGRRGAETQE